MVEAYRLIQRLVGVNGKGGVVDGRKLSIRTGPPNRRKNHTEF